MKLDLKTRFSLALLGVLSILMALFAISLYQMVREQLQTSTEQYLASTMDKEWGHLQLHQGQVFVDARSHGSDLYLQILSDGKSVFDSVPERLKDGSAILPNWTERITRQFRGHINGKRFEMIGYFDLHSNVKYLSELRTALFRKCLMMLLLLGPLSWGLAKLLLRPFQRLSKNTLALNAKTLSFRFPEPKVGDEYGILVKGFNNLLERLESAFQQIQRFSGNVSHELRTPLTVIRGEAEWMLRRKRSVEEYEEGLQKIVTRADGIQRIINRLLFLADLERRQLDHSVTLVPVRSRVVEILDALKKTHSSPERQVDVVADGALFKGPSDLFSSIATNLLENAVKYSKTRLTVDFRNENGGLVFRVEDDGPGISQDKRAHVFEPFFKIRSSAETVESHGLGLSIVKACVEAISGKIELGESKLGGLLVSVWLPQ
ncbi:MAG: HAMP domain-containing histidine kinase [Deltaproteobacteria bacterium]|nr:HAMP domain-containing histidine kinase [Deltaproteobacteria bacterium]